MGHPGSYDLFILIVPDSIAGGHMLYAPVNVLLDLALNDSVHQMSGKAGRLEMPRFIARQAVYYGDFMNDRPL